VIYYGSTSPAMDEALAGMEARGLAVDAMRVRAFPFAGEIFDFIAHHELVFVVEQNRDAQLRALLINEGGVDPARLVKVLNYDGSPITARFILAELAKGMSAVAVNAAEEMVR
jgi:2-oxoglutarate ferredoxin oxidoreductase subunit alpha